MSKFKNDGRNAPVEISDEIVKPQLGLVGDPNFKQKVLI